MSTIEQTRTEQRTPSTVATSRERYLVETVPRRRSVSRLAWLVPVLFGGAWLADAYLKWQPGFNRSFMDMIRSGGDGQPGWLAPWYHFWEGVLAPIAGVAVYTVAVVETLLALALILGFARKIVYVAGALYSLGIWMVPEGFGHDDRAMYMDIGTAVIYVLLFAALWAIDACSGPRRFSLDALIERRFPRWMRIAEVRS